MSETAVSDAIHPWNPVHPNAIAAVPVLDVGPCIGFIHDIHGIAPVVTLDIEDTARPDLAVPCSCGIPELEVRAWSPPDVVMIVR